MPTLDIKSYKNMFDIAQCFWLLLQCELLDVGELLIFIEHFSKIVLFQFLIVRDFVKLTI